MIIRKLRLFKHYLVSLYAVMRLARNQSDTKFVYVLADAQDAIDEIYRARGKMTKGLNNGALEQLWAERYFPKSYDLDRLIGFSTNTLGHQYAKHMKDNDLDPDFFLKYRKLSHESKIAFEKKIQYIRFRISQTHDIWHVLTGFDTSSLGEAGLQGFYLGQFHSGFSAFIFLISILAAISARQLDALEISAELFRNGLNSGMKAEFLLGVKWEELWDEDIESVRKRFGIDSVSYDVRRAADASKRRSV